ncbi:MAG: tetraacyldisaccharide 4'-kinase [Verrucomicrobia bacterium]|nr:tetraacyldisaccharide 4'-kinase [Verrucomicrobiota bacterium]
MDLERSILQIIRDEKKAPVAKAGLAALSVVYRGLIAARNFAYDQGLFSSLRLPVPVVSVGNVVVGGTGKTPLVHLLAGALQDKVRLGILTRGFRSQIEKSGHVKQISSGSGPRYSAGECGDEPYFLAQKTRAQVWVGADRRSSGKLAIGEGVNCILLDDGMQHRRLKRDFEIVIVDGSDPFSKGRFLPWGLLRDSPKRLKNADLIVATHVQDQNHYLQLQNSLSVYSRAPVIGTQIDILQKECFSPRKVGVFCGIGQPARFLQTARDLKSEIVDTLILKDHGSVDQGILQAFAEQCKDKGAVALLCTEKDYVKLSPGLRLCLDIVPVGIELKIIAGKEHWEHLIEKILDKVEK